MRRLYVAPENVREDHADYFGGIGAVGIDLIAYTRPENAQLRNDDHEAWLLLPEVITWIANGRLQLIQATVDHNEYCEDVWHAHPDVAILPHPTFEGTTPLSTFVAASTAAATAARATITTPTLEPASVDLAPDVTNKIEQKHLDALAIIGILATDNVWDVSDKAAAVDISTKLRAVL